MDQTALALPEALLEREDEVERVRGAVRAGGQQAGVALIVEGTAGIGKSRLLEVARVRATELGLRVLNARATELEQGFPFGVIRQLFERALLEADAGERGRWLAGAAALAAELLTEPWSTTCSGAIRPRRERWGSSHAGSKDSRWGCSSGPGRSILGWRPRRRRSWPIGPWNWCTQHR